MTIRIAEAGRANARPVDTVHPAATNVRFRTDEAGTRWVPASRALPVFRPGLVYEFPDTSGMHDILTYEMLQAYCESHPRPAAGLVRQPDDPGTTEPPAMRSAWQDDEPAADPRRTRWVLAWFFLIACPALAVVALWQAWPDFWKQP